MNAKNTEAVQHALDELAQALPEDYIWPRELRQLYERACAALRSDG